MDPNGLFRIVLPLLIVVATMAWKGCDSESISKINSTDTLQIEFKEGDGSYSSFQIRIMTSDSYGCNARIAYRFINNKSQETVFDIIGVEPGDGQCDRVATTQVESVDYTTQRNFKLELRKHKKVTRYRIYRKGSEWSDSLIISDIPTDIQFIEGSDVEMIE